MTDGRREPCVIVGPSTPCSLYTSRHRNTIYSTGKVKAACACTLHRALGLERCACVCGEGPLAPPTPPPPFGMEGGVQGIGGTQQRIHSHRGTTEDSLSHIRHLKWF